MNEVAFWKNCQVSITGIILVSVQLPVMSLFARILVSMKYNDRVSCPKLGDDSVKL
jgi:hypothetical protein